MPALIMAAINVLIALFSRLMGSRLGMWVVSALTFLGLSFGTQTVVIDPLRDLIQSKLAGTPAIAVGWMGFLNLDAAMTIVLSAYVVRTSSRLFLKKRGVVAP